MFNRRSPFTRLASGSVDRRGSRPLDRALARPGALRFHRRHRHRLERRGCPGGGREGDEPGDERNARSRNQRRGRLRLSTLPAGTYTVAISKTGFRAFTAQRTPVTLNTVVRVDAALQVGTQAESVTVVSDAIQLQTDRADVHGEFSTKQIEDIPRPPGRIRASCS